MRRSKFLLVFVLGFVHLSLSVLAQFTPDEIKKRRFWEEYLKKAKVVSSHQMSEKEGVTCPWVLTLKKDGIIRKAIWKDICGFHKGFQESWKWEIAAYRLDRLLGLNMIPPTVERRFWGRRGSLQLWVESKMDLREKYTGGHKVPEDKLLAWCRALCRQQAFDNLIANEDRHQGNLLITQDWRVILIDHSRTFRTTSQFTDNLIYDVKTYEGPFVMRQLPKSFFDKMAALDFDQVKNMTGKYLAKAEIKCLLKRRDLIIENINLLITKFGRDDVFYADRFF